MAWKEILTSDVAIFFSQKRMDKGAKIKMSSANVIWVGCWGGSGYSGDVKLRQRFSQPQEEMPFTKNSDN